MDLQVGAPEINMDDIPGTIRSLSDNVMKLRKELDWLMKGNLDEDQVYRAGSVVTDWVYANKIEAKQIDVTEGRITTAQIEDLIVGGNVTMGPGATISWGNVSGRPNTTYIDAYGIYTGTVQANQINTAGLSAEKIYQAGYPNNYAYIGGVGSGLILKKSGSTYFAIDDYGSQTNFYGHDGTNFLSSSGSSTSPNGEWDFISADAVYNLYDKMYDNPFRYNDPIDFVRTNGSQNIKLAFFEGASENFFEVYVSGTYKGSFALY